MKFAGSFDLTFDAGTKAQKALLAKNVTATVKLGLPGTVATRTHRTVAGPILDRSGSTSREAAPLRI